MVKQSLADTWSLFKQHVFPISLIVLPIAVSTAIIGMLLENLFATGSHFQSQVIQILVTTLTYPIYSVAIIFYIVAVVSGERIGTSTLWRLGIKFWLPYTILSFLLAMSVTVGFILLIVPGLLLWVRWSFSSFELLLNRSRPIEALRTSWKATRNYVGVLVKGYLMLIIMLYGPNILLTQLMQGALGKTSTSFQLFDSALDLVYVVLNVMFTIFAFQIYSQYRLENQVQDKQS